MQDEMMALERWKSYKLFIFYYRNWHVNILYCIIVLYCIVLLSVLVQRKFTFCTTYIENA